jgi:hypothetical protein
MMSGRHDAIRMEMSFDAIFDPGEIPDMPFAKPAQGAQVLLLVTWHIDASS